MNNLNKSYLRHTPSDKRYKHLLIRIFIFCSIFFPNSIFCAVESTIPVTVFDGDTKEALIGVSIFTDGHDFVTQTDIDGKAILKDLGHRDAVNFTYVGYSALKIPMYQIRQQGGIVMMYSENVIEGVVVIGRTDASEEELPYVIDRITASEIASETPKRLLTSLVITLMYIFKNRRWEAEALLSEVLKQTKFFWFWMESD